MKKRIPFREMVDPPTTQQDHPSRARIDAAERQLFRPYPNAAKFLVFDPEELGHIEAYANALRQEQSSEAYQKRGLQILAALKSHNLEREK